MYPKRAHCPGASSLAVLLALGLAGSAQAASWIVSPAIDVEQTYDDNVLSGENEANDPRDQELASWGTRFAPSVTLTRKSETTEASVQGGLTRRNTYHVSDLDGTDELLDGSVRRFLSRRLSVGARANYQFYASYNAIEETAAGQNLQVLFAERPEATARGVATDLTYALDDATQLIGELEWNDWEYDSTDRFDLFDTEDGSISLTLTHQLTPLDKLGAVLSYGVTEEEPSEAGQFVAEFQTHDELGTLLAYWQRAWSPRWSTTLQGGVRTLDTELEVDNAWALNPFCGIFFPIPSAQCPQTTKTSNSGNGFIGGGSISHKYSERGQVSFSYSRDTRTGTTSSTGASAIDTDRFSISLSHNLSKRVTLSLNGSYYSYQTTEESLDVNSEAQTRMHVGSVRLDWLLRKNMTAYARFDYFDIDQVRPLSFDRERDYARRIYGVGVRYFFDREL